MSTVNTFWIDLSGSANREACCAHLYKHGRKSALHVACRPTFERAVDAVLAGAGIVRDPRNPTHPGAIVGTYTTPSGRTMRVNVEVITAD